MKSIPLLIVCLFLSACAPKEEISKLSQDQKALVDTITQLTGKINELNQRLAQVESVSKLKGTSPRWAVVDKNRLDSRVSEWQRQRQTELENTYSPEVQSQISNYKELLQKRQMLERKLTQSVFEQMRVQTSGKRPSFNPSETFQSNSEWVALNDEVNKAYKPIASLMTEKTKTDQQTPIGITFTVKSVIDEYATNRFDLVLNKSNIDYEVPYRADNEYLDITQGALKLLECKIQEISMQLAAPKPSQP